jgi:GDP-L-fucose synthase
VLEKDGDMKRKVIVLGGYGFLGSHVCAKLKKLGIPFVPVSRRTGCDARSFESLFSVFRQHSPTHIINCAAHVGGVQYVMRYGADIVYDNLLILNNLYRVTNLAFPKAVIINPVSNCSYPGNSSSLKEPEWEMGPLHSSVLSYASTRRMIYALSQCYWDQYKLKSINWLVPNAYGPGDYLDPDRVHALNGIILRLIRSKRQKSKTFEIWGTGKPTREWIYIEDAAKILVDSLDLTKQIYPINIAQNKAYSVVEIAQMAADALKYPVRFTFNTKYGDGAPAKILDDKQFRKHYPEFKFTPIKKGISKTIEYYEKNLV